MEINSLKVTELFLGGLVQGIVGLLRQQSHVGEKQFDAEERERIRKNGIGTVE